jgi:signal transduction histidine kinase/CheY-like chemotaxis protein
MKNKSYKIDFEIYIVFIIVISISVFNAIYSTINISRNQDATSRIMVVDVPSLQSLEKMNLLITKSKMYSTNWVYLQSNKEDKGKLRMIHEVEYPTLKGEISTLMTNWKDREEIDSMKYIFAEFEKCMVGQNELMRSLVNFDDYEDAVKKFQAEGIIENQILPQTTNIISQLNRLIQKKKSSADLMHTEMLASSRTLMWSVLGIAILIVVVILIAAFYMSNHIIVPTMKLKNIIVQMARGEIPEVTLSPRPNAVGQMTEAVSTLAGSLKKTTHFAHAIGEGNLATNYQPLSEHDELGNALIQMQANLRIADEDNRQRTWVSSRSEKINEVLRENTDDINKLSDAIISTMVKYLNAFHGGLYLLEDVNAGQESKIVLHGSYGMHDKVKARNVLDYGEGLIGQAIKDGEVIYLQDVPSSYTIIGSGLGSMPASHVLIIPLKHHDKVYGAVELAGFNAFQSFEIGFVKSIGETIGSTLSSVISNTLTKRLLEETRLQAARLKAQEEELLLTNEELSNQSRLLQASEEELKQGNIEMKVKARELEHKNEILEQAREAISIKAKELELNNRYKSEFLANMSHELRTPLNSVLILAKLLSENKDKNLSDKQAEYARVIHKSGNDLLILINDILDLSKIEAGKIELLPEQASIQLIKSDLSSLFTEVANEKEIDFEIENHSDLPESIFTDKVRLEQIIKNLLANAFKFTPAKGKIVLRIKRPNRGTLFSNPMLRGQKDIIEFSVTDTGIGIPAEKQALIFEAFQQADGSTSRKYGGTGLGLSISKMLVSMLGGEMQLISEHNVGSTFFVYLPENYVSVEQADQRNEGKQKGTTMKNYRPMDDRDSLRDTDKLLLIVESDITYANVLLDMAHEKKYKAILAIEESEVMEYAEKYNPAAIIIDEKISGVTSNTIIEKIRSNRNFEKIPMHILSEFNRVASAKDIGATAYLRKPLDKRDLDDAFSSLNKNLSNAIKNVLIVEDMSLHQEIIKNLLASHYNNTDVHLAKTVSEAQNLLSQIKFDCIILDLDLGNGSEEGCALLKSIKESPSTMLIPVIVFTGTDIDSMNDETLLGLSDAIVSKDGESLDKLMKETSTFLTSIDKPKDIAKTVIPVYMEEMLAGKQVLLVDDDMRNIYALTNMLENNKMRVIPASNGRDALEKLAKYKDVDIILMDIMMPEMDGFEAMQQIRKIDRYKSTPILALTAKAMVGDKEKCIQCGASDYISKPVNMENLFSMMRIWLFKED